MSSKLSTKKKLVVVLLPVLAVAALGFGGYQAWLQLPPAMPESADDIERLLSDERFLSMSNAEKRAYHEHINEMWGSLSKEDQRRLGKFFSRNPETQQEAMLGFVRTFETVLTQDEETRNATIDLVINFMESEAGKQQRAKNEAMRLTPEGQTMEEEAKRNFYNWLDTGDPQTIGYGSEIMKLFQERREERGLPPL